MRSDTKAGLKMLGWIALLTIVGEGIFLIASFGGLPQGPTVGSILLAVIPCAFVLGWVYGQAAKRRDQSGDKSAEPHDPVDKTPG